MVKTGKLPYSHSIEVGCDEWWLRVAALVYSSGSHGRVVS